MELLTELMSLLTEIDECLVKSDVNTALNRTHECMKLIKKNNKETGACLKE